MSLRVPIDPNGDLDQSSDEGLLALAYAWASIANKSLGGNQPARRNALECFEAVHERGVAGGRELLLTYLRRTGMFDEAIRVCHEAIARGENQSLVEIAWFLGDERAIEYLNRAIDVGVEVPLSVVRHVVTRGSDLANDDKRSVEFLVERVVSAAAERVEGAARDSNGEQSTAFDSEAWKYLTTTEAAISLLDELHHDDAACRVVRDAAMTLSGPLLRHWMPVDPQYREAATTQTRQLINRWAVQLMQANGPEAALERLEYEIDRGNAAMNWGKAHLLLDLLDDSAHQKVLDCNFAAIRAGVPGARSVMCDLLFDRAVLASTDDEYARFAGLAASLVDTGDVADAKLIVSVASRLRSDVMGDVVESLWQKAALLGNNAAQSRSINTFVNSMRSRLTEGISKDEFLATCDNFARTAAILDPEMPARIYESVYDGLFVGDESSLGPAVLHRLFDHSFDRVNNGDRPSFSTLRSALGKLASSRGVGATATYGALVDRVTEGAVDLARQFPSMVKLIDHTIGVVRPKVWAQSRPRAEGHAVIDDRIHVARQRLLELRDQVSAAAYEADRSEPFAVAQRIETLATRGDYQAVLAFGADASCDHSSVIAFSQTATAFGRHDLVDQLWASRSVLPPTRTSNGDTREWDEAVSRIRQWGEQLATRSLPEPYHSQQTSKELRSPETHAPRLPLLSGPAGSPTGQVRRVAPRREPIEGLTTSPARAHDVTDSPPGLLASTRMTDGYHDVDQTSSSFSDADESRELSSGSSLDGENGLEPPTL